MKKLISIFAALLVASAAFCQSVTFEKVCNQLGKNSITKGDFQQIKTMNSAKGKRELKSNGEFILCLNGIMWKTLKPFPSTMVVGVDYVIQIAANGTKSVKDTSENQTFSNVAATVVAVFSNDYAQIQKNFTVKFTTEGKDGWSAVLVPKDKTIASVMSSITLKGTYSANSATLDSIIMSEGADNTTTYIFTNQKYPKELTADEKSYFLSK
ncbi:MAG: outer membrane lipoprotein carrier protein LolA [Treponema sp.]|nr:outer membrane lipoprotein carrier protein LolA [Treponema sp.]